MDWFISNQPSNWSLVNEAPCLAEIKEKHLQWAEQLEIRVGNIGCEGLLIFGATFTHRHFIGSFPGTDRYPGHTVLMWDEKEKELKKTKQYVWFTAANREQAVNIISDYQKLADEEMVKVLLRVPRSLKEKIKLTSPLVYEC